MEAISKSNTVKPRYRLDGLVTVEELAGCLRLKQKTIWGWIQKRTIPFTRMGRRVYVAVGVVEEILRHNAVPALPTGPSQERTAQGGAEQEGTAQ